MNATVGYVTEEYIATNPAEFSSGVSWAAIIAGAFVTAALSLILLALGAGVGLSALSPWSNSGATPHAVGFGALIWLCVVQIISAAIGGYMAGRLRTKWTNVHTDEVYFRDTAHGFLVWAVALVVTAAFLTTAASAMVGSENQNARMANSATNPNQYFVDTLFRSTSANAANTSAVRTDVSVVFAHALAERQLSGDDKSYVTDAVATNTGMNRAEAEQRVTDAFQRDQAAADAARKAVAHSLYWLFVALLLGAFCASFAATWGGRRRDHVRRA